MFTSEVRNNHSFKTYLQTVCHETDTGLENQRSHCGLGRTPKDLTLIIGWTTFHMTLHSVPQMWKNFSSGFRSGETQEQWQRLWDRW